MAGPLLNYLFGVDQWLGATWWSRLLGGVLVVGVIEQYLVYLTVRYLVFEHPEFNERVDGVVYAVAAGLGVATVINFQYVLARGGVDLDIGSLRMVINALAYASFAGLLGYFIGQARFERVPWHYLPLGLLAAASLNGLLFFVLERPSTALAGGKPWASLALAAGVALAALLLIFWLIARANEETLRVLHGAAEAPRPAPGPALRPALRPAPGRAREGASWRAWFGDGAFAGAPVAASVSIPQPVDDVGEDDAGEDGVGEDDEFLALGDVRPQQEPPPPRAPEKGDPTGGDA